ncbi:MAG TPA: response regulator [Planctomycetota bacterium]|nr:response regulator [Planctomycetota bacterium]
MKVTDFTLLLVEDDPNDILLIQRALAKGNLVNPMRIVRDGEEAISYLSGQGDFSRRDRFPLPSLILLDLKLPRKSGLEVLEWLRNQPDLRRIPVIVLTSSRESADISRAYELGANSYLVKPVDFDGLLEMVKAIGVYWIILNKVPEREGGPGEPSPAAPPPAP